MCGLFFANQRTILRHKWQLLHRRRGAFWHTNKASSGVFYPSALDQAFSREVLDGRRRPKHRREDLPSNTCASGTRRTPSSTIASQNQPENPNQNLRQSQPRGIIHRGAQNPPKDPNLPRERRAFTSKQVKQPPKALSPSPSSPH